MGVFSLNNKARRPPPRAKSLTHSNADDKVNDVDAIGKMRHAFKRAFVNCSAIFSTTRRFSIVRGVGTI
jgi:hypothetical protein